MQIKKYEEEIQFILYEYREEWHHSKLITMKFYNVKLFQLKLERI
jgi:hypothetical protein